MILFLKCAQLKLADHVVITIAVKVAEGVNYMHSHNPVVIHQDLKPPNILVGLILVRTLHD